MAQRSKELQAALAADSGRRISWEGMKALDPDFSQAVERLVEVTWAHQHLDAKTRELISIAMDTATTHLYLPGIRNHMRDALTAGATPEEIVETMELTSFLGTHTLTLGVRLLLEALAEAGTPLDVEDHADDPRRREVAEAIAGGDDHGIGLWDELVALDPDFAEAWHALLEVPERHQHLDRKTRALIGITVNASTTQLHEQGVRHHLHEALAAGATRHEIMETLELTSFLGTHTWTTGVPYLLEALDRDPTDLPAS